MAFDLTKLDGYKPEMTAEEKLALLDKYEPPAPDDAEAKKWKAQFDRAASELAAANKALKAKMTEDEQKEAERLAAEAAMKAELEALRREKTISDSKAKFLGLGYDEKLATETAKALADGDMEKVFANQQIHIENVKKAERAAALAGDQSPAGKNDPPKGDRAKLIEQYNEAEKRGDFVMCQTLQAQIKALPKE